MIDYSKSVLSKGLICFNKNNFSKCVVLDGEEGSEDDRCSLVLELGQRYFTNHVPNRALVPSGEIFNIDGLEKILGDTYRGYKNIVFGDNGDE